MSSAVRRSFPGDWPLTPPLSDCGVDQRLGWGEWGSRWAGRALSLNAPVHAQLPSCTESVGGLPEPGV